jgi:hypothetical protein
MKCWDSACDSPQTGCGHLRVFSIFFEGDPKYWVHLIDYGVYDGKGDVFGRVRAQPSQEFVFFNIGSHPTFPGQNLLADTVRTMDRFAGFW